MTAGTPNTTNVPNLLLVFILNRSPLNIQSYQKKAFIIRSINFSVCFTKPAQGNLYVPNLNFIKKIIKVIACSNNIKSSKEKIDKIVLFICEFRKMCLILLSYEIHSKYRMVLAANRDEYYDRPTAPVAFHDDSPDVLGGRDLKHHGMWLGITRTGRLAAITNYRDPGKNSSNAPSRGFLVRDFLTGNTSPEQYLEHVKSIGHQYNGFNLLVGDRFELCYYSNRGNFIEKLKPGIYGLSNHLMDTPWPKISKGKHDLESLLKDNKKIDHEDIFDVLKDGSYPPDSLLPDTGVDLEWERILSPLFISSEVYGTRSSSIVFIEREGKITFLERTFVPDGGESKMERTRKFTFQI